MKQKDYAPKITIRVYPEIDEQVDKALILAESDLKEAQRILNRLLFKYPRYYSVFYGMGVLRLLQKEEEKALEYFEKAVKWNPFIPEAWFNMGVIYKNRLDIGYMIDSFLNVIEYGEPDSDFVITAKGIISKVEKIARKDGLSVEEYRELEVVFLNAFEDLMEGYYDDAIAGFEEVIKVNPNHVQSYGNLGLCYGLINEVDKAFRHFDKAIELDPEYEPAVTNKKVLQEAIEQGKSFNEIPAQSLRYYRDRTLLELKEK